MRLPAVETGMVVVLLALASGATCAETIAPGEVVPLAVDCDGGCDIVVPSGQPGDKYYLIVGALARAAGPFDVKITTTPARAGVSIPRSASESDPDTECRRRHLRARLEKARARPRLEPAHKPAEQPPARRDFHLFVKQHEFDDPAGYATVNAELRGCGQHCLVYVDVKAGERERLQRLVDDVVRTFDREVHPRCQALLGNVRDVDRDGRFTILLTGWLSRLYNGSVSIGGFVRGSDFHRDLPAPLGNRCDMMFLNTNLEPGPHLRTLLAHEYTHAVLFSEHVFGAYLPDEEPRDEEGWLNEGIAHAVEEQHGFGWSNLDHRVATFLNEPGRFQLVVPDYYSAGLWRSHGNRGATFLFLRYCVRRGGAGLLEQLSRSSLAGTANLEVALDADFAELFRAWSTALLVDEPKEKTALARGPLGCRALCGPRFEALKLAGAACDAQLAGTAARYFLLHSPAGKQTRIRVEATPDMRLQATLIRLPADSARLEVVLVAEPDGRVRLRVTAHDGDVWLETAVHEPQKPPARHSASAARQEQERARRQPQEWLGVNCLRAGETRTSPPLTLPAGDQKTCLIKVAGRDGNGRPCSGWAVLEP